MSTVVTPAIAEFTVEFGDARNRSTILKTIRQQVRGHFSLRKFYESEAGGRDIGSAMQTVPDIPGLFMSVEPKKNRAVIYDPWEKKPEMWERLNKALTNAIAVKTGNYGPVARSEMTLSPDQTKTLCHELAQKVESGTARVVKGTMPTREQIDALPGRLLNDVMNSGRHPRYADELEGWQQKLDTTS